MYTKFLQYVTLVALCVGVFALVVFATADTSLLSNKRTTPPVKSVTSRGSVKAADSVRCGSMAGKAASLFSDVKSLTGAKGPAVEQGKHLDDEVNIEKEIASLRRQLMMKNHLDPEIVARINELTALLPPYEPEGVPDREGLDQCPGLIIPSLPYTDSGNTCGYSNDYDQVCPYTGSTSPDVVYQFTPSYQVVVTVDLCASLYDTKVYVMSGSCTGTLIACNDDACNDPQGNPYRSKLTAISLSSGVTYYIIIDGYGGECGDYTLNIWMCMPPPPECPDGAFLENEPVCGDNYVDATNGGCNSEPPVFQHVECGMTICGESGTYLLDGDNYRDTDWFSFTTTGWSSINWTVAAIFPLQIMIITLWPNCDNLSYIYTTGDGCMPASLETDCLQPGDYWLWVGPSVFEGVPCGSDWVGTVTCTPCECPAQTLVAPGSFTGTTCGAGDDCALRAGEDVTVQVTIPHDGLWTFSLCNSPQQWDTYMYLTSACCGGTTIAYNDDACETYGLLSKIEGVQLTAGTYYVDVESYSPWYCGNFTLDVFECAPVECPPNALLENEPLCGPDYVDYYNGGCDSYPYVFQDITCPITLCGTSGTYLYYGSNYRDTDWFRLTTTEPMRFTFDVVANFAATILVIRDPAQDCYHSVLYSGGAGFGEHATIITRCLAPSTYYFWVGPSSWNGVACGSLYVMNLTSEPCEMPPGETCDDPIIIESLPFEDSRNSCDYQDDMNVHCHYSWTSSPDIAYQYVPGADGEVDLDLCDSYYDTEILVYENGELRACNDDYCGWDDRQSFLGSVWMSGGNVYCIVVDGHGQCGDYVLRVTGSPSPPCEPAPLNDDCENAGTPRALPAVFDGDNTCATHDCPLLTAGEGETWEVFEITQPCDVTVSYCGTPGDWENYYVVLIPDCPCSNYYFYSGYDYNCSDGNIRIYHNGLPEGIWYIPVLRDDYNGAAGPYYIEVSCAEPCDIVCEPGDLLEGEPICYDGYIDTYNGGCNSDPYLFGPELFCNQPMCGTSGVYDDASYRDTDWMPFTAPFDMNITFTVNAEFPVQVIIITPIDGCNNYTYIYTTGARCTDVSSTQAVTQGSLYWMWVGPSSWDATIYCGIEYRCWITCELPCEFPYTEADMGDLPTCDYPTLLNNPAHGLSGVAWLGESVNGEATPNILDQDPFDDGVTFNDPQWLCGVPQSVTVTVNGGPSYSAYEQCDGHVYLNAWKDGNLDSDFADDANYCSDTRTSNSEWIIQDVQVVPGVYTLTFVDPGIAELGTYNGIFRFRLTSRPVGRHGYGLMDLQSCPTITNGTFGLDSVGEVEDYIVEDLQLYVELSSFSAAAGGDEITLNWVTASETNNDHFEIVRDGIMVARVNTKGNGATGNEYTYVDEDVTVGTTYSYTLFAVDINGNREELGTRSATPNLLNATVTEYALHQNYPNPFNPTTNIMFDLVESGSVSLKVYNLMGQEVATVVNGSVDAGRHIVTFNADHLSSGVYLYRLTVNGFSAEKKMLLIQ